MEDKVLNALIKDFAALPQVEAIALAGSHTIKMNDQLSDYDLYIYVNEMIPVDVRREITARHCSEMELNNQYWETEDDGRLTSGVEIELLYRDLNRLDQELDRVVFKHQVGTGYSTCFWSNLLNSKLCYDNQQQLSKLQQKYRVEYSTELAQAVVDKNMPLLCNAAPAYPKQVSKALQRGDALSVQHRLTEYLASYFDLLFAINRVPHPGEKRLVKLAQTLCAELPTEFEASMANLLQLAGQQSRELPAAMYAASEELKALAAANGLVVG